MYFENVMHYTFNSGDTSLLKQVCSDLLQHCGKIIAGIEQSNKEGNWKSKFQLKAIEFSGAASLDPALNRGTIAFRFNCETSESRFFDAKRRLYMIEPSRKYIAFTDLDYIDGAWTVVSSVTKDRG